MRIKAQLSVSNRPPFKKHHNLITSLIFKFISFFGQVHRRRNRGHWGHGPQGFAINQEELFSFSETTPFFLRKKCPRSVVPSQVWDASYVPAQVDQGAGNNSLFMWPVLETNWYTFSLCFFSFTGWLIKHDNVTITLTSHRNKDWMPPS